MLGLFMSLYSGLAYVMREKTADRGKLERTKNDRNTVNWQPYLGILTMVIGCVVFVLAVNKKDEEKIIKNKTDV
jgi:membrane-associated HD superfamily phosphohydrolase